MMILTKSTAFADFKSEYQTVVSCKSESGNEIKLKISDDLDDGTFSKGPLLYINKKEYLIFDKDITYSTLKNLFLAKCVRHIPIFVTGYSSYLVGVAIKENLTTHTYERIIFSEKEFPHWLYFKHKTWGIIIPSSEYGFETNKKYIVYSYTKGKSEQNKRLFMNNFPVPKKDLIRIPLPKDIQ